MSQANVRSVDAIRDFKNAVVTYAEEAHTALTGVEMEIRQTRNWLERDQLSFWKAQVKRGQEAVAEARTELHRRKLSQGNSDAVSDAEQKENLRNAQRRLHEAEEMVERVKKWIPILEHAIAEYHSQSQPLGDHLAGRLVNSLALLDRMIISVEQYLATEAPSAPVLPPTGGVDTGTAPAKKSAATTTTPAEGGAEAASATTPAEGAPSPEGDGAATTDQGAGQPREAAASGT